MRLSPIVLMGITWLATYCLIPNHHNKFRFLLILVISYIIGVFLFGSIGTLLLTLLQQKKSRRKFLKKMEHQWVRSFVNADLSGVLFLFSVTSRIFASYYFRLQSITKFKLPTPLISFLIFSSNLLHHFYQFLTGIKIDDQSINLCINCTHTSKTN